MIPQSLEFLLGQDPSAFMERHFGRSPHLARGALARDHPLFDWSDLNRILNHGRHMGPRLRLERDGRPVENDYLVTRTNRRGSPVAELRTGPLVAHLRNGATLIFDAVDQSHARLGALCHRIASDLAADVQVNLYAAWRDVQGFDTHWDAHDVFVMQTSGRKKWLLFGMGEPRPMHIDYHDSQTAPADPVEVVILEEGDVLYIPRGYWHAAVGLGEPTLHLTLGISQRTGSEFLSWIARDALHLGSLRETVPLHGSAEQRRLFARQLLDEIASADAEQLIDDFERFARGLTRERPTLAFPEVGLEPDPDGAGETRYALARKSARIVEEQSSGDAFKLRHGRNDVTLHACLRPLVESLMDGETVTAARLRAACEATGSPEDVDQLITRLVDLHILVPA